MKNKSKNTAIILNNIRSSQNVGSIFRTADAAGVSKIFLCGYTPAPVDRFGRLNKALSKASLGAEKLVEWEKVKTFKNLVKKLKIKNSKIKVVGVEQDKNSIDYRKLKKVLNLESGILNIALVFGNEVTGLSKKDLKLCDVIAEIPMKGSMVRQAHHPHKTKIGKESLNVSVAAGIVLFNHMK